MSYLYVHNICVTIAGFTTTGNGMVCFSYISSTDSANTDIDIILSEINGDYDGTILPATGFLFTSSNKYIVASITAGQDLIVTVYNASSGTKSNLTYRTDTGTFTVTDSISPYFYGY